MFQSLHDHHQGEYIYQISVYTETSKIVENAYSLITCSFEESRSTLSRSYDAYTIKSFTQENEFYQNSVGRVR
jgi:hypothetical protein